MARFPSTTLTTITSLLISTTSVVGCRYPVGPTNAVTTPEMCVCYGKYYGVDRKHLVDAVNNACTYFSTINFGIQGSGGNVKHWAQYTHRYDVGPLIVMKPEGEEGEISVRLERMGGKDGNPNSCPGPLRVPEDLCEVIFRTPFDVCNTGGENGKQGGHGNDMCFRWTVDPNPAHNEPGSVLQGQGADG